MMGQEAEAKVKLEFWPQSTELEQTHLGHRKGWQKSKSGAFNFKGKTVPEFLGWCKQGKRMILELSIVGLRVMRGQLCCKQVELILFLLVSCLPSAVTEVLVHGSWFSMF